MMGAVYGYKMDDIGRLTFEQIDKYMKHLDYVIPESKKFGRVPPLSPPAHKIITFAQTCGVHVPTPVWEELVSRG